MKLSNFSLVDENRYQKNFTALQAATILVAMASEKIGTQCVHVSAIWKFTDHLRKKAMHASRMKDICVLSL